MKADFEDWKTELLAKIDSGLKKGRNLGADALELYIINTHSLEVLNQSGLINPKQGGSIGVGCRCVIDQKVGFAASSGISDSDVNFTIESAIKTAKTTQVDNRWKSFINTPEIGKDGIIDQSVLEFTPEEVVKGSSLIYNEAKAYDPHINSFYGNIVLYYGAFAVGNSEGIAKASVKTAGLIDAYVTVVENGKTKNAFGSIVGRGVPNFEGFGASVAKKAIKILKTKPLGYSGQMNVIFNNRAAGQLFRLAIANIFSGKSVVEGRSAFSEKMGKKIGVSFLNVCDDGQIPEDPKMQAIDGEGFPRGKIPIIENGVLKNYIFDHYYSQILGTKNTGNATRQSYISLPSISPNTISVAPGTKDLNGLAEEIEKGVLVNDILLGIQSGAVNVITGDFSLVAPFAFRIEHGEISTPLESITVAGNLYKAFNQIIALGNETNLINQFFVSFDVSRIPSIAFKGYTVSG